MNAPTPDTKTYKYMNNAYSISIKVEQSYMVIDVFKEEDIPKKRFEVKITLEQLIKISKTFRAYDSIEEIEGEFNVLLQDNKYTLQEQNDKILLIITSVLNNKKEEINIELQQILNQQSDILLDLCDTIKQMKNTLVSLDDRIIKVETNLMKMKRKQTIAFLDPEFQGSIESIISNEAIKFELIYKATKDGDSAQSFHSHCDNKGSTFIVIQTTEDIVFGGYTSASWLSSGYKKDPQAFLFSNTLKKIYLILKNNYETAINTNITFGPIFGAGHDIIIRDKCLTSSINYVKAKSFEYNSECELNSNESNFKVKELEVYAVLK